MNDNFNTRMLLTTAVFAAVAALLVGPASAGLMDVDGGGSSTADLRVDTLDPAIATAIATRQAVQNNQRSERRQVATDNRLDPATRAAIAARHSQHIVARPPQENVLRALTEKGPIPYQFQGEQQSLGLTGDSPITRIVGQEPAGLTGDGPRTRGQVFQANSTSLSSNGDTDVNWTWVGFGAGMAALLAAAMGALYLSARHRDRVALP